jgi:hypothetical protein
MYEELEQVELEKSSVRKRMHGTNVDEISAANS